MSVASRSQRYGSYSFRPRILNAQLLDADTVVSAPVIGRHVADAASTVSSAGTLPNEARAYRKQINEAMWR